MRQSGNEDAASSEAWLEQTLDEILARVRAAAGRERLRVPGRRLGARSIRPAAAWFADEETREALDAVLTRPYDPERGGVTEAAIERGGRCSSTPSRTGPGAERAAPAPATTSSTPTRPRARGRGTRARRTSRARSAPPTGGRSACSRSRARTRSRR